MNIKAKAGKKILSEQPDKYRLNLSTLDDYSPVLVLEHLDVDNGQKDFCTIAELDMSGIFEQVFHAVAGK